MARGWCPADLHPRHGAVPGGGATQIELDVLRTFPGNKFFNELNAQVSRRALVFPWRPRASLLPCSLCSLVHVVQGLQKLRRVLVTYSWHNHTVGYCQGLNMLAATALLYLAEEAAFWLLFAVVECILPRAYYTHGLAASQADKRVLRNLKSESCKEGQGPLLYTRARDSHCGRPLFKKNPKQTIREDRKTTHSRVWALTTVLPWTGTPVGTAPRPRPPRCRRCVAVRV